MSFFTASLPTPQFRVDADCCSRYMQQDSAGNLYVVIPGEYGPGALGNLEIWKSIDDGHTWALLVNDVDRGTNHGTDVCMIADVLHVAIVNASVAPNSRLGMYRYSTAGALLSSDFGGPADSAQSFFVNITPMFDGSVNICYKSNDFNGGLYTRAKVANWLAGVWGASVVIPNENVADLLPQWAIKEALTERVHYFFGDDGNNAGAGDKSIWHVSIQGDGTTVNTLQQIKDPVPPAEVLSSKPVGARGDIGAPSILGADLQLILPYVIGPPSGGSDNIESLRVLRAVPANNPVWTDEEAVAAGAISDGNIEPFLSKGYFDCSSVVNGGTITLIFTFTDDDPASADVQGWLYTTSTTVLAGGWTAPALLFTAAQPNALANPYSLVLSDNGQLGIIVGGFNPVLFPAYAALGLTFIGEIPEPAISGVPPGGGVGTPYTFTFTTTGGTPPYTFAITVGSLPPGLTLNPATSEVSGTPTLAGTFCFTIQVTDSLGQTAIDAVCITIISILCDNPPVGIVRTLYVHDFPVDGGVPPFGFDIVAGSLPPGLILDPLTGEVSGTPTVKGIFPFTIRVTDSNDPPIESQVQCSITIQKRCLLVEVA